MYLAQRTNWGHFLHRNGIRNYGFFKKRGKPEFLEKNVLEQGRKPTTNIHTITRRKVIRKMYFISQ